MRNHLFKLFISLGVCQLLACAPFVRVAAGTNGNWSFQFATANTTYGILLARPNSTAPWGIVCDYGFTTGLAQAMAACRSLGLPTSYATARVARSAEVTAAGVSSTTLIYMDDVDCSGLIEPMLPQCRFLLSDASNKANNCYYGEAVYVSCSATPPTTWEVSLSSAGGSEGLLLVRPDSSSAWGLVCDDQFFDYAPAAACNSLFGDQYVSASTQIPTVAQLAGYTTATIYMDNVQCNGSSQRLPECSFIESTSTTTRHNCQTRDAVYLRCTLPPALTMTTTAPPPSTTTVPQQKQWEVSLSPPGGNAGLLLVRPSNTSAWGVVCDDAFGAVEAAAACRSIYGSAFTTATARTSTTPERTGYETATIYMDDVNCAAGQLLQECSFIENHNCLQSEAVYLACTLPSTTAATTTSPTPFATTISTAPSTTAANAVMPATTVPTPKQWQVALATNGTEGLLLVRPSNTSEWGVVCDDQFTDVDAAAACRSIFGGNRSAGQARTSTAEERTGYTAATIYMDDVNCTAGQRLQECSFIESAPTITRHNCEPTQAIAVICSGKVYTKSPILSYTVNRDANSSAASTGDESPSFAGRAAIIGPIVGCAAILLIGCVVFFFVRRLHRNRSSQFSTNILDVDLHTMEPAAYESDGVDMMTLK